MEQNKNLCRNEETKKRYIAVIFLTAFLSVLFTVLVIFLILNAGKQTSGGVQFESGAKNIVFSESEVYDELISGNIQISGSEKLYVKNGLVESSKLLCNFNKTHFLKITLKLDDEILYESGLIAYMMGISDFKLYKKLPKGEYKAEMLLEYYKTPEKKVGTEAIVKVLISVN